MLFKVVSVLVACTASEVASSTTSTPSITTPTMAARILRRQLNTSKELQDKFKNFNPIDFHSSTFIGKINSEEFGTGLSIGKWVAKVATIFGFVGLAGGLVSGVLDQLLKRFGLLKLDNFALANAENGLVYTGLSAVFIPTLYGLWKVKSARKAYIIMLIVDAVGYTVYATIRYGSLVHDYITENAYVKTIFKIAAQCAFAFVLLFNWYKVVYPTWTGINDW